VLLFAIVFLIVIITSSLIAHVPQRVHPELIPVAFAAVIVSILFDPRIGMIAAMVLAVPHRWPERISRNERALSQPDRLGRPPRSPSASSATGTSRISRCSRSPARTSSRLWPSG
jgi:hypothetical protein